MARPNAVVDVVNAVAVPEASGAVTPGVPAMRFAEVSLAGGRRARLDLQDRRSGAWATVLEQRREAGAPVYLEIDPATSVVVELLLPLSFRVGELTSTASGDIEVELVISHARHFLRRSNPDVDELLGLLRRAREEDTPVLVTETLDGHDIIDVRPSPKASAAPPLVSAETEPVTVQAPVSPTQAQQIFNTVNARTCCPTTATTPCIPFTFPDDGCWGRAHEMCRLMIETGLQPAKVWIYGSLQVATANNPACKVEWGWHVAPTLLVDIGGGGTQVQVIDPSLFPGPVPQAVWAGVQGDPAALLVSSNANVFLRYYDGSVTYDDASYTETKQVLATYRQQLILRSAGASGPPPYPQCAALPVGTQWFGTIAGGTTKKWFTYNWPAGWHVVWTVMPQTVCPGAPQLSWDVYVERASATYCTYWISVKNLTSSTVRFEGRYDVLSK